MRIGRPRVERTASGGSRIEADVDGVPLWFASDDVPLDPAPEVFASALLLPAATRGEPLRVDAPLDRTWFANAPSILRRARAWWGLKEIRVVAAGTDGTPRTEAGVVAQCFTGGVDSFYALLRAERTVGALLFVHGYDIRLADRVRLDAFLPGFRETAVAAGARPIVVASNLREHPAMRRVNWEWSHGGALAAAGHAVAGIVERLVVPSSYPYHDAKPWGTHWDLDPLWSSERLTVVHADATFRRDGKVRAIAADPRVRRHLRVCWENRAPAGNCSRCEKCVRTLLAFAMCGSLEDLPAFDAGVPLPVRLDDLGRVAPHLVSVYEDLRTRIENPELAAAVDRLIARSRRSRSGIAGRWRRSPGAARPRTRNETPGPTRAPRVMFVPVSGPTGTGELIRCAVIARALRRARPDVRAQFVVDRSAPSVIEAPLEVFPIDGSPTRNSAAVNALIDEQLPDVVVFDNAGRAAQVRRAREVGARIVYVSRRPGKRLSVLRPGWIGRIDQHWLAFPREIEGAMTGVERGFARILGRPEVVDLGAIFEESEHDRRAALLARHGLGKRPYVLVAPGGGGRRNGTPPADGVFLDAAARILAACGPDVVVVAGPQATPPANDPDGVVRLSSVAHRELIDLIHDARLVVTNGGTTLTQALAHARAAVAVPLADDQPNRIRRCARRGAVVPAPLDPTAIAAAAVALLRDGSRTRAVERAAASIAITNGVPRAVAALARLLPAGAPGVRRVSTPPVAPPRPDRPPDRTSTAREVVERLRRTLHETLDPLIPPGAACALLDFPDHGNAGDSMIWLGELAYLAARGARIVHACTARGYSAERVMRSLPPDGIVLVHGGGNFGDLYPAHQELRERIVADFPDRRIVQLPQSVYFGGSAAAARARGAMASHAGLTVLVRDRASLGRLRADVGVEGVLCPDMAFALGPLPRTASPTTDVVCLARDDAESVWRSSGLPNDVEIVDWADLPRTLLVRASRRLRKISARGGALADAVQRIEWRTYAPRARSRADVGRALLSRGRAVVTDRLHGHVLALLLGIPHVLLDNRQGKVLAYHETWTADAVGVRRASTPAEAVTVARALAEEA